MLVDTSALKGVSDHAALGSSAERSLSSKVNCELRGANPVASIAAALFMRTPNYIEGGPLFVTTSMFLSSAAEDSVYL